MSVKEIREIEDDVREIETSEESRDEGSWVEEDFVDEDKEELGEDEQKEFSIGDTMLARGEAKEVWGGGGLEEELEGEEFDRGFDDDVFEEEEDFGEEGFSYDAVGQGGSGDLYGAGSSGGSGDLYGAGGSGADLYGAGAGGVGDLYGAAGHKGSDSVSMYNTGAGSSAQSESSLYNTGAVGKKSKMNVGYDVGGVGGKKKRRGKKSGLETGVVRSRKKRSKGVSMI